MVAGGLFGNRSEKASPFRSTPMCEDVLHAPVPEVNEAVDPALQQKLTGGNGEACDFRMFWGCWGVCATMAIWHRRGLQEAFEP